MADKTITWDEQHAMLRELADLYSEWAGIPVPLEGFHLQVEDRYPYKGLETFYAKPSEEEAVAIKVRNYWYSRARRAHIYLLEMESGRVRVFLDPITEHGARLTYWVSTMGASQAWSLTAELEARRKLQSLISTHLYEMYELTGSFLESSSRSGVTYILRRARPTIAMVPTRRDDSEAPMKMLTSLCLHPIAYYRDTWAGAMVPTDDVIAHLLMIRGDEHYYWRRANQHPLRSAAAGL